MSRRGTLRTAITLAITLGVLTVAAACAAPKSLAVSTVVGGLDRPWDLAFTPDGTMLVTQRAGPISSWNGSQLRLLADPADVSAVDETGMMGIAVDPQFSANRFIYTCFTSTAAGAPEVRLVRWRVNSTYTALTNRNDIITGIPVNGTIHHGCRPRFGPDGYLWVTTGDGVIGRAPQDRQSLAGKVLRVDRNGNGAPGNPGGAFRPEIYTYGHRNPQGIAFRPYDGKVFSVEHGTGCDDEINLLVPGGNYGWNPTQFGSTSYFQGVPMTDKVRHPAARDAMWSSGCPTIAPSGATFLEGAQWSGWNQALAVAVLKDRHLHVFGLDADGRSVEKIQWKVFEGTYGRLRSAVQGPDGDLYLVQDASPGSILRVHPTP